MLSKILSVALWVYGAACLASLTLAVVTVYGLFGVEPDGLGAVFALLLASPWVFLVGFPDAHLPALLNLALLVAYMALNAALLWILQGLLRRRVAA